MFLELTGVIIPIIAQATVDANHVAQSNSGLGNINFTILFSVLSLSLAAIVAFTRIFARPRDEDAPSKDNPFCAQHDKDLIHIGERVSNNEVSTSQIKTTINDIQITITELKKDVENSSKTITEMKQDNRELAKRLENLLSQLVTYVGD